MHLCDPADVHVFPSIRHVCGTPRILAPSARAARTKRHRLGGLTAGLYLFLAPEAGVQDQGVGRCGFSTGLCPWGADAPPARASPGPASAHPCPVSVVWRSSSYKDTHWTGWGPTLGASFPRNHLLGALSPKPTRGRGLQHRTFGGHTLSSHASHTFFPRSDPVSFNSRGRHRAGLIIPTCR